MNKYARLSNEEEIDYQIRICDMKSQIGNWQAVANVLNEQLGYSYSESKYRKLYQAYIKGYNKAESKKIKDVELIKEYQDKLIEIKKEKIKLSDERIQNNAYLRDIARTETFDEIAKKCARQISKSNPFIISTPHFKNYEYEKVGIVQCSDWHYGEIVNSFDNVYNIDIAKERIEVFTKKILEYGIINNIKTLYFINLGDLISGVIHLRLRLETRENVINQVIQASELLANMLYKLSLSFNIEYYDVLDNHSRLDPNKKDSLPLESFARITHWYLKTRFECTKTVNINENTFDEEICAFNIFNHNYVAVHGHNDVPQKIVSNLSLITKRFYDVCLTAHLHHFNCDEQNETVVISNGALMGGNGFSRSLRLSSRATQNLIIVSRENPCEAIYRIILN